MTFLNFTAACLALAVSTHGASAQQSPAAVPQTSIAISSGDLDLQTERGRAVLAHRISAAASRLCAQLYAPAFGEAWAECRRETMADARQQASAAIAAAGHAVHLASVDRAR